MKANNGEIPVGALSVGHTEDGEPLFVGRGEIDGSLTIGKVNINIKVILYDVVYLYLNTMQDSMYYFHTKIVY